MPETVMRAARFDRFGPPEVLDVREVPRPAPAPGQVLVKVHGSSVNPADTYVRSGKLRLLTGPRFPKGTGGDFAGEITEAGEGVDAVRVGERVWGAVNIMKGAAAAEYLVTDAEGCTGAPEGLDLVEAAALPTVGVSALMALDAVEAREGERLLVIGASGGVGSALVQLAATGGVRVAAVAGASNLDFCRELGAIEAYDYGTDDAAAAAPYDAIIDLQGRTLGAWRRRLAPGGRMATLSGKGMGKAFTTAVLPGPRVRTVIARPNKSYMDRLRVRVEQGDLRPIVERDYPLEAIAEAHRAVETGHGRGKRVIRVV